LKETRAPLAAYVLIGGTRCWTTGSFATVNPHKIINGCRRLLKELRDISDDKEDSEYEECEEIPSFKLNGHPRRGEVVLRIVSLFRFPSLSGRCSPRLPKDLHKAGAGNNLLGKTWTVYWALLFIHSGRVDEWINVEFDSFAALWA
jgi:hypothetical protein